MTKTVDNYWLADSSTYTFPTSVQVTSVLGDTVTDTVNVASPSGAVVGAVQFPLSSTYETVGGITIMLHVNACIALSLSIKHIRNRKYARKSGAVMCSAVLLYKWHGLFLYPKSCFASTSCM